MISAIVLTKNEELNIEQCLKSITWVDEIIVIDSESTDRTVEIAQNNEAKVYIHKFRNFSDQRNFAIEKCAGDWIFYLDADERPSDGFEAELRAIEMNEVSKVISFRIDRLEYFMSGFVRHGGFGLGQHNHHLRFWRKGALMFYGDVHEKIRTTEPSGKLKSHILHYSNEGNVAGFISKLNSYTTMEANEFHRVSGDLESQSLLWSPLKKFLGRYFVLGGYKDGVRGFIFIFLHLFYDFVSCAKKLEKRVM